MFKIKHVEDSFKDIRNCFKGEFKATMRLEDTCEYMREEDALQLCRMNARELI